MAATSSSLVPNSLAHNNNKRAIVTAFGSSSGRVRLYQASISTSFHRRCLKTSHINRFVVSPRCRAGSDMAFVYKSCNFVAITLSGPCIPVEKLSIVESEYPRSIEELCNLDGIEEAAVLCTWGRRLDIYVFAVHGGNGVSQVKHWISKTRGLPASEIDKHSAVLYEKDALEHLFKVSSGFLDSDSLVLDETQALAQLGEANSAGCGAGGRFGSEMRLLFGHARFIAKRVARETATTSSAFAAAAAGGAVELALTKLSECSLPLDGAKILVVGRGKMAVLVIKRLVSRGCKKIVVIDNGEIIDRDLIEEERAIEIVYKLGSEMFECVAEADVVFSAINSNEPPLFSNQRLGQRQQQQQGRQRLVFIDMSVRGNVSPCVASSSQGAVVVYNVDDLRRIVCEDAAEAANNEDRLTEVRRIIEEEAIRFDALRELFRGENQETIEELRELQRRLDFAGLAKLNLAEIKESIKQDEEMKARVQRPPRSKRTTA